MFKYLDCSVSLTASQTDVFTVVIPFMCSHVDADPAVANPLILRSLRLEGLGSRAIARVCQS